MLENVKVTIQAVKNDVEVPEVAFTWTGLTEQELLQLERRLNNVMQKMMEFGEKGERATSEAEDADVRGKLEFQFTAWNGQGFEIAWQGNRWTGIRGAEADFMVGILRGELAKLDTPIAAKGKGKGKGKAK
jgi:hypothetical protein